MYLLDSNVFIQAKNFHYRFTTFPCFWDWLDANNANGIIASTKFIQNELSRGADDLAIWASAAGANWFLDESDEATQQLYVDIANWTANTQYNQQAISGFLSCGDPWLIAKAGSIGATVVTHEKSDPRSKKKIFIPDVCIEFNIPYLDTFDLLDTLHASF